MGIRVELPSTSVNPLITENPVANNVLTTLNRGQGAVDAMGTVGGTVESDLNQVSGALEDIARNPVSSMQPNLDVRVGAVNGALGAAINVGPPRALQHLSSVARGTASVAQGAANAFNNAKDIVTDSKKITALALGLACMLVAALLQAIMSKVMGAMLRIQRTVLAMVDKLKKQAVALVEKAISAMMEALPECPQAIKDVAQELRSLLGKASTIVAAINNLMRNAANCDLLGGAVGAALAELAVPIALAKMIANSRFLVSFDFSQFKNELDYGFGEYTTNIFNNYEFYHNTTYINDTITVVLTNAYNQATENQQKIEQLIDESNQHDIEHPDDKDSNEYKQALEDAKTNNQEIIDLLDNAKDNLADDVIEIVDNITDKGIDTLNDLQDEINKNMDEIQESVDDIFDALEKQAEEFDTPEVQNQLVTACADTAVRTVINERNSQ